MRLRVIEEDEVGICRGCWRGTVMKINGKRVRHCSEINRIFEGKVTECSSYSPVGAKQLGEEDIPKPEPMVIKGRGWWTDNTYL